jgi:hypothetical protein
MMVHTSFNPETSAAMRSCKRQEPSLTGSFFSNQPIGGQGATIKCRDMLVIIRERVQAMIESGATLEQVKAARPTADYDVRFGATTGPWRTAMFVEAVHQSLIAKK